MLPVTLVHGYSGFGWLGADSLNRFQPAIRALGADAVITSVDPAGDLPTRSRQLARQIEAFGGGRRTHLIAHGMAGLDARFLVSPRGLHRPDLVDTLTTLGTPHRGTILADLAVSDLDAPGHGRFRDVLRGAAALTLEALPHVRSSGSAGSRTFDLDALTRALTVGANDWPVLQAFLPQALGLGKDGLAELTTARCQCLFDPDEADLAEVACFSFAGAAEPQRITAPLLLSYCILCTQEGRNDGVVPVHSASLTRTHIGTVSADHFGLACEPSWFRQIIGILKSRPE